MAASVLIPNRLTLAPAGVKLKPSQTRLSLCDITAPEFREGRYQVCHYPAELSGSEGPPALDQVLVFARELHCRLQDEKSHVVVVYTEGDRRFAAVLVGAFLVLAKGWSASKVSSKLPAEAKIVYDCSWGRLGSMRLQACWEGLQVARDLGWVSPSMAEDAAECSRVAGGFWRTIAQYDGSWLIPSKIFVMADPMTVVLDPNPNTYSALFPPAEDGKPQQHINLLQRASIHESISSIPEDARESKVGSELGSVKEDEESEAALPAAVQWLRVPGAGGAIGHCGTWSPQNQAQARPSINVHKNNTWSVDHVPTAQTTTRPSYTMGPSATEMMGPSATEMSQSQSMSVSKSFVQQLYSEGSVLSVCKAFKTMSEIGDDGGEPPAPLVTFFQEHSVGTMIRTNMINEPGLIELGGSYNARLLEPYGLRHADVPVKDTDGSVPDDGDVRIFLDALSQMSFDTTGLASGQALAIHCKSGFGRSVVFACLLAIYMHDVPGRALMGWARIVRPGSIISPQEESLLLKLGSRADLLRFCGASHLETTAGPQTTGCGCSVQ